MKKNRTKKAKKETNKTEGLSDNEIIIGVTMYPDKKNKTTKDKKKKTMPKKRDNKKALKKKVNNKPKKTKNTIKDDIYDNKKFKKNNKVTKIIKWTSLAVVLIGTIVYGLLSPVFNIQKITISGNSILSTEKINTLSNISIGTNIFRLNKNEVKKNIKKNGYIDEVNVSRALPNEIKISVTERTPTYIIKLGNGYIYINNQGYILETSEEKKTLPILSGISTPEDQLIEANRLNEIDLNKLNMVLKIVSVAEVNDIESLITGIDIKDENDYTLFFDGEQKTAHIGDCSNLETRMLYMTSIMKSEKGKAGDIFVNMNLNTDNAFFREKV